MRLRAVIAAALFTVSMGTATAMAQGARLQLFLPAGISSDKMDVRYVLYGRFGARGAYVIPKPDLPFLDIPLSMNGVPASEIKMLAWAPGCQIETFDMRLNALDAQRTYACTPQLTIKLSGRIADFKRSATKAAEVRIDYLAYWACKFFGNLADCMVPQISLATSKIDREGRFEIDVPSLASDPAVYGAGSSWFQVTLREILSGNLVAFLDPALSVLRSPGGGLKPASSYPEPTVFVVRKGN